MRATGPAGEATAVAAHAPEPILGAVVVARNEERHIARCLDAVLAAVADFAGAPVVLVDSRSTDGTVDIARRHPVDVIRVREGVRCTAALGRAIGQRATSGRYVLFVDGDTEIDRQWVAEAVRLLERDETVAGVGGKLHEIYYRGGRPVAENPDFFRMGDVIEDAYQLGGNAMYRRAALERVGSFNPAVISHEEAEVAERLRAAGLRLVRIPFTVGSHHTLAREAWQEGWRRFRSGLMTGYGQVLRLTIGTPLFRRHVRSMNRYLLTLAFLVAGVASVIALLVGAGGAWLATWAALAAALVAAFIVRARSVQRPVGVLLDWVLTAPAIVWGFFLPVRAWDGAAIERQTEWVQEGADRA